MSRQPLEELTDSALVLAIDRFQQDALAEVYRRHAGAIFGLASRLLDAPRAEDVTQEVFLKLWNEPMAFDPERGSLRTFLSTQTHSRAIDIIRSDSSRRRREERELSQIEVMIDSLEREVLDLATAEAVQRAYMQLPDVERTAIDLAYFQGHTYREVASMLGTPEGTIKGRIRSALKRLRPLLHGEAIDR